MTGRELPVAPAACALDAEGQAEQAARYRSLARSVAAVDVGPGRLSVQLDAGVDRALLTRTIDVERACCPFLAIDLDEQARTLTIAAAPEHQPVLEAFAGVLGA